MKRNSILAVVIVAMIGAFLMAGCNSTNNNDTPIGEDRAEDIHAMDLEEVERLPEEVKEDPINSTLEKIREFRKNSYSEKDGSQMKATIGDDDVPGQTKNRPEFSYDELYEIMSVIEDYVVNKVKVPRRGYGYDYDGCIDPRMNAIYDDEDKGVAAGYENANIFVAEYETAEDDVYSYLVLVRDSKGSSWEIIYDGLSYKE
jgi:hypothetical protein